MLLCLRRCEPELPFRLHECTTVLPFGPRLVHDKMTPCSRGSLLVFTLSLRWCSTVFGLCLRLRWDVFTLCPRSPLGVFTRWLQMLSLNSLLIVPYCNNCLRCVYMLCSCVFTVCLRMSSIQFTLCLRLSPSVDNDVVTSNFPCEDTVFAAASCCG